MEVWRTWLNHKEHLWATLSLLVILVPVVIWAVAALGWISEPEAQEMIFRVAPKVVIGYLVLGSIVLIVRGPAYVYQRDMGHRDNRIAELEPYETEHFSRIDHKAEYLFPHIHMIDMSPMLKNDEMYVNVSVGFSYGLNLEQDLKLTGELIMAGTTSQPLDSKDLWLRKPVSHYPIHWEARFDNAKKTLIKKTLEEHGQAPVQVRLREASGPGHWTTPELTLTPLGVVEWMRSSLEN
jgi:hypothetical protein